MKNSYAGKTVHLLSDKFVFKTMFKSEIHTTERSILLGEPFDCEFDDGKDVAVYIDFRLFKMPKSDVYLSEGQ